jgi:hypothetical protein
LNLGTPRADTTLLGDLRDPVPKATPPSDHIPLIFFWEAKMKVIVLLVALCSFSEVAVAQSMQCQSVPKASDRLACYDRAAPPMAAANPTTSKTRAGPANPAAS